MLALLRCSTRPDSAHGHGVVQSVYFDTQDLAYFHDALNGDYRKQKIRLRWYGEARSGTSARLFLEVKRKKGFVGHKMRSDFPVDGRGLADESVAGTIEGLGIGARLNALGVYTGERLRPVIHIRYERHRLVDIATGTPLSLDLAIRSRMIDRTLAVPAGWLELRNAVIEVKGLETELPPAVSSLRRHLPVWTSYSKYARCLAGHLERSGSVGWLTPL